MTRTAAITLLFAALGNGPAMAQEKPAPPAPTDLRLLSAKDVENRLNGGGICSPLSFDLRDIGGLIGITVPSFIPIDTNLRWDQSRHSVETFDVVGNAFALEATLGCQPSTNGSVLEYVGLSPDSVRLTDRAICTGDLDENGTPIAVECAVEGRIGRTLARFGGTETHILTALAAAPTATTPTNGDAPDAASSSEEQLD